jgi:cytochrome oxidase Cu insertion factor (SCO1/SenC/PrrC family)
MSDLTVDDMRKALKFLREYDQKDFHLMFLSPLPEKDLPEEFIKMLPEGTEIKYPDFIPQGHTFIRL